MHSRINSGGLNISAALCRARSDFLTKKLEEVERKLQEAKMGRRENERDRKMAAALAAMRSMFPGTLAPTWHSRNLAAAVLRLLQPRVTHNLDMFAVMSCYRMTIGCCPSG